MKHFFVFHVKTQANFFLRIYFDLSLSLSFSPLLFFSISSFVAHFIDFLLHGIVAGQLFRKGTNLIFKAGIQ